MTERTAPDSVVFTRRRPAATLAPQREWDGFFAFALFAPMLFVSEIGTLGAAVFSLVAVIYAAISAPHFREILGPRAFILLVPLVALLSTIWSDVPAVTLKYSLEFALTVGTGLLLSAAPRPKSVLWGIFLAFALYIVFAVALGHSVNVGADGETAFSGLSDSKNLLADLASTGLLISTAVFFAGIEDRRLFHALAAVPIALLQGYVLFQARSAGAILGLGLGLGTLLLLLGLRHVGLVLRVTATLFLSLCVAVSALMYSEMSGALMDMVTRFFDKDSTLTGRTYLWQRAGELIADRPILGEGFNAFWLQGNPDAEGLWRYGGITTREGFNFHNTFIEILVQLGWAGLVVIAATVVVSTVLLGARLVARPTLSLCFWAGLLAYQFVRMPVETIGVSQFYFSTVLLFVALGSAVTPRLGRGS